MTHPWCNCGCLPAVLVAFVSGLSSWASWTAWTASSRHCIFNPCTAPPQENTIFLLHIVFLLLILLLLIFLPVVLPSHHLTPSPGFHPGLRGLRGLRRV